jgi:hypothetical protein
VLTTGPRQEAVLSEEELADVSLSTFHVFDNENAENRRPAKNLPKTFRETLVAPIPVFGCGIHLQADTNPIEVRNKVPPAR